ncbi:MAG: hypothetical protein M3Z10_10015 [Gemmatimonadota bacterium]|nr:hypothetical protein [Gemmatimonadota bacterium]
MSTVLRQTAAIPRVLFPFLVAAAVLVPAPGHAQRRPADNRNVILSETPETPNYTRRKPGFDLFALGDLAVTGMKMTGQFGWLATNLGPCSDGFTVGECGDVFKDGSYRFNWFEVNLTAGTPPSEFRKIRSIYPTIGGLVKGDGWTTFYNYLLFSGRAEFGPADAQIGKIFSGVTSTTDGSCRDNQSPLNGYIGAGISLLAGSTCPETWGPSGFGGPRPIPDSAFIRAFDRDKTNFRFDSFKIPDSERDQSQFLGDFSTYGEISDHYQDILKSYGGVTPLGSGAPTIGGYPLGLDVHFDAYSFALPTISNAAFYNFIVVNNSKKVYGGAGVDFDSLYMGLETGFGAAQANAVYYIPSQSTLKETQSGVNPGCNGAIVPAGVSPCANIGFASGVVGIVMLKSPIGDMRNKLLTRPGSPFFSPTNVNRGDTITFNHGHSCGFGGCWANTWNANDKRAFGMISSTPSNIFDGRSPNELATTEYWRIFKNKAYPTRDSRFNAYIPGNWDYNHDGIQDTLHFDTCDLQGCVATFADTMPGKQVNRQGNVGGAMTAGPFKLKSGDTTSFVMAFIGAPDSASFEALVNNVIDAYTSFFLTPKPPTPPVVSAVEVQTGASGDPLVNIHFTDAPVKYVDRFLLKFAADLATSSDPSLKRLRTLNPTLVDSIRARATTNLAEVLIFKSCTDGATFTRDASCQNAPAVDQSGKLLGNGFQAYAILKPDANYQVPLNFLDRNVIGGRTYLYSFVTRSKGFRATVKDSAGGTLIARELVLADTIQSALQRSGPTVAKVYVPITFAAGAQLAKAAFQSDTFGRATIPVGINFTQRTTGGSFRLVFGNRFIVTSVNDTAAKTVTTTVVVQTVVGPAKVGGTGKSEAVTKSQTFTGPGVVQLAGSSTPPVITTSGKTIITTDTVQAIGFLLVTGLPPGQPLFISTNLTGTGATPSEFLVRSDFPGFLLNVDASTAGALVLNGGAKGVTTKANGDTIRNDILNSFGVQYQGASAARPFGSGAYVFTFADDAFGPGVFFKLRTSTQQDFAASLTARPVAATGATSARIDSLIVAAIPSYAGKPLIAAKFPFAVQNTTFGRPGILAMVKRSSLGRPNSIQLGSGNDTLSVTVPEDVWVPGDEFVVLEAVTRDSMVKDTVVINPSNSRPFQVVDTVVTLAQTTLGCTNPRASCNPLAVGSPGATGYLPYQAGWKHIVTFNVGFSAASDIAFQTNSLTPSPATFAAGDFKGIRVVPNPWVFQSQFDQVGNQRIGSGRIMFTGLPATGTIRIYSVSGQFLQQLTWTEADLNGTGDLPYNLQTRESLALATGLYVYVVTGKSVSGQTKVARGKFVVIR